MHYNGTAPRQGFEPRMAESESDVLPVTLTGITRKRQDSNLRWA